MAEQVGSLYARVGADASSFHRTMGGVSQSLRVGGTRFSAFGSAGSKAFGAIAAGGAAIGVLKGAVSAAADFGSVISQLGVQTNQGAVGMAKMSAKAIALGADVRLPGTSAADAASAMLELAKGGQKMGDVMKSVRGVLVASAAGEMSNADAANTVVGALGAFNLKASESVSVANLLAGGANASTASMQDMAFALQMGGSAAAAAHVPIQTFVAMTAEMANAGIKGSDAGTSLKQMFLALTPTSKKASEAIDKYSLSAFDAHHAMLPMPVIVAKYHKALAKMSDEQRISTLKTIFGSDAYRAANVIFGKGSGVLASLTKEVSKEGQAAKLAAAKNSGMKGVIDGVKSSWNTFQIVLGQRVAPAVEIAGKRLSGFIGDVQKLIQPSDKAADAVARLSRSFGGPHASPALEAPAVIAKSTQMFPSTIPAPPPSFAQGLQDAVARAFRGIDWAMIGNEASAGFMAGMGKIADNVDKITNTLMSAFAKHRSQLADIGAQMIAAIFVRLADPSFWAKNWDLALGVALAVGPGKFAKVGGKLGEFLLKPFAGLGVKLGALMGDAVLTASEAAGGKLGMATLDVALWVSKAGPAALKAAIKLGAKVVEGTVSGISKLGFTMRTVTYTAIVNVLTEMANAAYNFAENIGSEIVHGALDGVKGLGSSLKGAVQTAVSFALHGIDVPGFSPVAHAGAEAIGKPIMVGAAKGVADNAGMVRGGLAKVVASVLDAARAAVESKKSTLQNAFGQLGEDIGNAFEAGTTKGLAAIAAKFAALTPSESALAALQSSHDSAGRQDDVNAALGKLSMARAAGGDPQAILDAQKDLDDAMYAQQVAALTDKAATERAAADKAQASAELEYQAQRDLQQRHLDTMLANLETQLEKHPTKWKSTYAEITTWFKKQGNPDLTAAGENLGKAFAVGLDQSRKQVGDAAKGLAAEVQKYLQLHSPAEAGPLSSLDSWWTAMPKTLLSGLDPREMAGVTSGIASPGLGAALAAQGGGGGDTFQVHVNGVALTDELDVYVERNGTKIRDALLPIARRNGGSIFAGNA